MTLEALHIAGACFTTATLAVVLVLWVVAEQRRAAAERRIDALLGVMAETLKHATIGAANFDKAASMVPQPAWLEPVFEEAQFGASRMRAIERTTEKVLLLTRGDQHGRQR
jgi:hypothetical protein